MMNQPVHTNAEFKEQMKARNRWLWVIPAAGLITFVLGLYGEFGMDSPLSDKMLGVYTGMGLGLFVVGVVLTIRNHRIMKDEAKLKAWRLKYTDERNIAISRKAWQIAAIVLLAGLYLGGLIGGLFIPVLVDVLLCGVCLFLVAYAIAWQVLNARH
ncbi:MAG: hypothetical protein PHI94_07685 [Eubacteriaceae bacterium]|jgi:hypothetical protein|nr:hypothetical protein [Eubacteriaceae bacterium]MDD4508625.1 hypothetical protein [Eubacteriaceae bacterium]